MTYLVMLGSNLFARATGVLTVTEMDPTSGAAKDREFFRIREIDRTRSLGSYLVVDCDIKDADGVREIKLAKSQPVAISPDLKVLNPGKSIEVRRADGSLVIKVEEVDRDSINPPPGPVADLLPTALEGVEAILRFTGDFHAGPYHVIADVNQLRVGGAIFEGNLQLNGGGLRLGPGGFSF